MLYQKVCVVIANGNVCKIYYYHKVTNRLELFHEMQHNESKLKEGELTSDRSGHYHTNVGNGITYSERVDHHSLEKDSFAKDIATVLNHSQMCGKCDGFVIFAPDKLLGMVKSHIHKSVANSLLGNVNRNYCHLADKQLNQYMHDHWQEIVYH